MSCAARIVAACIVLFGGWTTALQSQEDTTGVDRPMVRGDIYDKPYLAQLAGRTAVGGYVDLQARYSRVDGVKDEFTFLAKRFNLFFASQVSDFIRFAAELEFEDAGEEINLEFAAVDLLIARAFALRAGMILVPLGKFNLSHDSPLNEFTDRPLVSTQVFGVALSEPGIGALGIFPVGPAGRITYQVYAVNGFDDGLITDSDGTRIPEGRRNFEDNNNFPSLVGRVAWSPRIGIELGASLHTGPYNVFQQDGQQIDEKRNLTIWVLDVEADFLGIRWEGEGGQAHIDVPTSLQGIYAQQQQGFYFQGMWDFGRQWIGTMPKSFFSAGARVDVLDLDTDIPGDDVRKVSLGFNFRPTGETVFKFNYVRGRARDRFNNPSDFADFLFSVATYF
jgi:hypothetical protein